MSHWNSSPLGGLCHVRPTPTCIYIEALAHQIQAQIRAFLHFATVDKKYEFFLED